MWNTPNVIQLSSKENLRYPTQAKLIRYYTAIIFLFLSPIPSRKQKLKNIKMPFPKRSFPLLGGGQAQRVNIDSVTLRQLDFVVTVTECESSSALREIPKQQRHINHTCVNGIPSSHKCSSGWCTKRLNIIIVEYNPFSGQRVNGWSVDFWSMKSNVAPPEIISKHKQNVRRRWFSLFCLQWTHCHEKCERKRNKTSHERHVTGIWNDVTL